MKKHNVIERDSSEIFVNRISKKVESFINDFKNIDIVHFLGILFIMYSFNSYFGLAMFDSQPFPFLMALIFMLARFYIKSGNLRTPTLFIVTGILSATGILFGAFFWNFSFNMLFIRGIVNYASIFILMIAFYEYIRTYGFPIKILVFLNVLWLLVAILQLYEPNIVSLFVAERTGAGRGVTSLSPEPSTFGFYLFFTSWIYLIVTDYDPPLYLKIFISLNVFSIFFLAISAMTIVFLFVSFCFYIAFNFKKLMTLKNFSFLVITILITLFVIFEILEGSRMERLFNSILNADLDRVMEGDRSVNSRLAHQILPIYIFFSNFGLPAGLQSFAAHVREIDPRIIEILWGNITNDKIMSWSATVVYELGLFGVLILVFLFIILLDGTLNRFGELLLLFVVLFSSVPLSYPLIPLILVIFYMTNKRFSKRKERLEKST